MNCMYIEQALELHKRKFNCCQSVLCAFSENLGIDESLLFKIAEGFGAGMGNTEGPCGALTAVIILAGLIISDGNMIAPGTKKLTYALSTDIVQEFKNKVGYTNCCDIKNKSGYSCNECIEIATEIAENIIKRRKI